MKQQTHLKKDLVIGEPCSINFIPTSATLFPQKDLQPLMRTLEYQEIEKSSLLGLLLFLS
jgi:hypothetical protein